MKEIEASPTFHSSHGRLVEILTGSGMGRVTLHVLCLVRHPSRLRWHWRGIAREIKQIVPVIIFLVLAHLVAVQV